jgi:hypothetical protein
MNSPIDDAVGRRGFLRKAGLSSLSLYLYQAICRAETQTNANPKWSPKASGTLSYAGQPAKSLIVLWLDGGPSQLETFDPHPGSEISGPTKAIPTNVPGIQFAEGLPQLAEKMNRIGLIRSMVGTESDHARARYLLKTGYPISGALVHPMLGSICSAHLPPNGCSLPSFISICSDYPAQAGYLGEKYKPYGIQDPKEPLQNIISPVSADRLNRRIQGLRVLENSLARRNPAVIERTLGLEQTDQALAVMNSSELKAFDFREEPTSLVQAYGDSSFGRGCLVARRLVESGVRCVEVQFSGWDTHEDNFNRHRTLNAAFDPAFASLLTDLETRQMLDSTLVLCLGEFGRTPKIEQSADGREHWPKGFSVALAGGFVRKGVVVGATDPAGLAPPTDPVSVPDLFATILACLGINPASETIVGDRPVKLSEGRPVEQLLRMS